MSKFQQDQTIFVGVRVQKIPKRGHFMDTESIQKTLNILNFTTTYAILMKLTSDIYRNKVFHLAKSWDVPHKVYKGINKKPLKMSQKINFFCPI